MDIIQGKRKLPVPQQLSGEVQTAVHDTQDQWKLVAKVGFDAGGDIGYRLLDGILVEQ